MSESKKNLDSLVYNRAFDVSPQGICVIDPQGVYVDVNQTFADLLGYSDKNELIGKSIESVTHPDDLEMDLEMTKKIFAGDIDSFELDKRFVKKNGDVTWLKLHANTHNDLGIGILEPIKERTELEGRIAKLKKDLDQFIYRISHDVRAPVANILALTSLEEKTKDDLLRYLGQARSNAQKLDHIIREINDYAINRSFSIKEEEISLSEAIDEICEDVIKAKSIDKKINVVKKVTHHNGVKLDHSRFNIVLKNLLTNALNFADKDGNIDIKADVKDSELVVTIKDDGVGIRKDIQAKIYDMFYRGSNISEGAGLGLYIVKDVLKEINGSISFQSDEGVGTEFTVKIPVSNS